jgi:micrococcal nuclease
MSIRRPHLLAWVVLISALAWLAHGAVQPPRPDVLRGVGVRAVDGDTLVVRLEGGRRERVRVIGVDTPEDVDPRRPVQCYSRRAAAFTARTVEGHRVSLTIGRESRDRYGRLLAYVRVEGAREDLEEQLLRRGFARPLAIRPNTDRAARYARLADEARARSRGLWGACPRSAGAEGELT